MKYLVIVLCTFFGVSSVMAAQFKHHGPCEKVIFPHSGHSGGDAIQALGTDIDCIAHSRGVTVEQMKKSFLNDATIHVGNEGSLFINDLAPEASVIAANYPNTTTSLSSIPDADTFKLHTRPGSSKVVYVNFLGGTMQSSAWNGGTAVVLAPFAGSLNDIKTIWAGVAEDYAAFDLDVTTEQPNIIPDKFHFAQVYVTPTSSWYPAGVGGISYVGSFTWGDGTPSFVFADRLANGARYIKECVSHETGHTLGLQHQSKYAGTSLSETYNTGYGSGNTGWAPIMGNSYYQNITLWSNDECPGCATPYGSTVRQDDIAVMMSSGGLSLVPKASGNTLQTASVPSTTVDISGVATVNQVSILSNPLDVGLFRLNTLGGSMMLQVNGPDGDASFSVPNLNFNASLLDSNGQVLISSTGGPAKDALTQNRNAILNTNLNAGTYYVKVVPISIGDPTTTGYSTYSARGRYQISANYFAGTNSPTPTPTPVPTPTPTPVDVTPPSVSLLYPANLAIVPVRSTVALSASATDNVRVDHVEFYVNGSLVCIAKSSSSTFGCNWNVPRRSASFQIQAKAFDTSGNSAVSTPISVTSR